MSVSYTHLDVYKRQKIMGQEDTTVNEGIVSTMEIAGEEAKNVMVRGMNKEGGVPV